MADTDNALLGLRKVDAESQEKKERKKEIFPDSNTDSEKERFLSEKKERKKINLAQLSIKIPEDIDERLELYCFQTKEKKQEVMARALDALLSGEGY